MTPLNEPLQKEEFVWNIFNKEIKRIMKIVTESEFKLYFQPSGILIAPYKSQINVAALIVSTVTSI